MFKKLLIALIILLSLVLISQSSAVVVYAIDHLPPGVDSSDTITEDTAPPSETSTPEQNTEDPSIFETYDEVTELPSVSDVKVTVKGPTSATINWKVNRANNYIIKYGVDQNELSNTLVIPNAQNSIDLNELPAGQQTYFEITPNFDDDVGNTYKGNFKTLAKAESSSNSALVVLVVVITILLLGVAAFFVRRLLSSRIKYPKLPPPTTTNPKQPSPVAILPNIRPQSRDPKHSTQPQDQPFLPSVLTPEAEKQMQATLERLESQSQWWLPDSGTQKLVANQQAAKMKAQNDVPDMFALGKKRLEEEEKDNLIPKY